MIYSQYFHDFMLVCVHELAIILPVGDKLETQGAQRPILLFVWKFSK